MSPVDNRSLTIEARRPSVTIIIPVKNGAPWLGRALASTREQGVPHELIVVDDDSTDDSSAIARAWPGANVISAVGRGAAAARNTGLRSANTEWVQFLDADDRLAPGKLDLQLAAAAPDSDIVFSEMRAVFDAIGENSVPESFRRHRSRRDWVSAFGRMNVLAVHAPVSRRRTLLELGGFPEGIDLGPPSGRSGEPPSDTALMAVDWVLWARAALRGSVFQFVPGLAGYYHHHSAAATADHLRLFRDELLALRELTRLYAEHGVGPRGRLALALGYERVARELWVRGRAEEAHAALAECLRLIPSPLPEGADTERDDHLRGLPACLELAEVDSYWSRRGASRIDQPDPFPTTAPFPAEGCETLTLGILRLCRVVSPAGPGLLSVRSASFSSLRRAFRSAAALASMRKMFHQGAMRYGSRPWRALPEILARGRKMLEKSVC